MAKGKRSGRRAEDVIASRSMKHHDFIGESAPERAEAQRRKQEQAKKEQQKQQDATVREMAREFEQEAGLRPSETLAEDRRNGATAKGQAAAAKGEATANATAAGEVPKGLLSRGLRLLEDARDEMPRLLEALRLKAEERLAGMPRPVKQAVHRAEQAAVLLAAPARVGVALARELLRAPLRILGSLRRRET
jgi:hypothetical protein